MPTAPPPDQTTRAPDAFRDALAELVQVGLSVARLVGQMAEAETALAVAAAQAGVADGVSALAGSLAEAIEADRAAAAAAEARQGVVARAGIVADAFAQVSRSVRLTVSMAERMDRGWARGGFADDRHALAQRQIARGVAEAVGRAGDAERQAGMPTERPDALDTEATIGDRPTEDIIRDIVRGLQRGLCGLGLDPALLALPLSLQALVPEAAQTAAPPEHGEEPPPAGASRAGRNARPPRRPDG